MTSSTCYHNMLRIDPAYATIHPREVLKVRFSRRNRNKPLQARREAAVAGGSVASEERSALLGAGASEAAPALPAEETPLNLAGDPTQRLMTALTRFHRFVAKGDSGAPQEYWSDDCMGQLAAAAEIAASQEWMHIVDVLTGTARVLQSHEDAGSAHLSVGFLNDCYEDLCLMVSDLIVDKQRPEVAEKWHARYEQAVADLTAAGLTLVEDEPTPTPEESPEPQHKDEDEAMTAPEPPADDQRAEEGEIVPFEMPKGDDTHGGAAPIETPSMDDFLPFPEASRADEDAAETADAGVEPALAEAAGDDVPQEDDEAASAPAEVVETIEHDPVPASPAPVGAQVGPWLDALCEDLAALASAAPEEKAGRLAAVTEKARGLHEHAEQQGLTGAVQACQAMRELCRAAGECEADLDDGFFDTAYAFCEVYVAAAQEPDSPLLASWCGEAEALCAGLKPEPPSEAPADAPPEDGSAESLLGTAQAAIARGDMSGAKALALQAVVNLAEVETGKAEKRVEDAETRFSQNAEDIEKARASVTKAEQDVVAAESRVAECQAQLADARAHGSVVADKVQGLEQRVAEIDEQIRQMQAARESELERISEARGELEQAREDEEGAESEVGAVQEAEQGARVGLEEARQNVKDLQRKRLEMEEMLSRARETLTHHRTSLGDVERTISQLRPREDSPAEDEEDLLF